MNTTTPNTTTPSVSHTKEFLIQCKAQNNTFQCSLDQNFRDLECQQRDLALQYVTSSISSPQLGSQLRYSFYFIEFTKE
jgi:invasion protein IalB